MGYYVDITESNIFISKDKLQDCYEAMCKLNDIDDKKSGGGYTSEGLNCNSPRPEGMNYHPAKWFSWMDANYPEKCKNMEDILHELGFENIRYDENGNLIDLSYNSKIGDEELFFESMARFIYPGSYINWRGEDNEIWQWYFDGENLLTKTATITWE
jgi:hypothetical protein